MMLPEATKITKVQGEDALHSITSVMVQGVNALHSNLKL